MLLFDRHIAALDADCVIADSVEATKRAILHLSTTDHRWIAIIAELRASLDTERPNQVRGITFPTSDLLVPAGSRLLGYLNAHWETGLPVSLSRSATGAYGTTISLPYRLWRPCASVNRQPTLYSADNVMTFGAYRAIRKAPRISH